MRVLPLRSLLPIFSILLRRFGLCTIFAILSPFSATLFAQSPIVDYHQHLFSPQVVQWLVTIVPL